uniref:Ubiquitin-fold modifier 1 n=1 Tax=Spermophilus dauricus TaxID=99837 RepID=A0A8C9PHY9_SPEDA
VTKVSFKIMLTLDLHLQNKGLSVPESTPFIAVSKFATEKFKFPAATSTLGFNELNPVQCLTQCLEYTEHSVCSNYL